MAPVRIPHVTSCHHRHHHRLQELFGPPFGRESVVVVSLLVLIGIGGRDGRKQKKLS